MSASGLIPGDRSTKHAFGNLKIIGHRGASAEQPENTVQSAKAAFGKRASGTEFDVQLTADRKIIVLHDTTLNRTASIQPSEGFAPPNAEVRSTPVTRLSYKDELERVDVGSYQGLGRPEKVPLMEDIMDVVTDPAFVTSSPIVAFCELKRGEVEDMVVEMQKLVRGSGEHARYTPENLIFISFDIRILYRLKQKLPEFKFLFIACGPEERIGPPFCSTPYSAEEALAMARFPRQASEAYDGALDEFQRQRRHIHSTEMLFAKAKAAAAALQAQARGEPSTEPLGGIDLMAATDYASKEIVSRAHAVNMEVAVWVWPNHIPSRQIGSDGGDTLTTALAFADAGVDYFTSNLPADISAVLVEPASSPGFLGPAQLWTAAAALAVVVGVVGFLRCWRRGVQDDRRPGGGGVELSGHPITATHAKNGTENGPE